MRPERRRRRWLGVGVAVAAVSTVLYCSAPRSPVDLLVVAAPISNVSGKDAPVLFWTSDTTYVTLENTLFSYYEIIEVDVRTGVRRPLKELTQALQAITLDARLYLDPSPDGKWLLVHDRFASFGFQAVSFDGLKTVIWDKPDGGSAGFHKVCWLTSSRQWVLLSSNPESVHISTYSLDNPKSIHRSNVSGFGIGVSEYYSVLAGTDKDRLLTVTHDVTRMKSLFRQVDVRSGMGSLWPMPISSSDQLVYVSASSDRSRLAWLVSRQAGPAMPSFLAWLPPVFHTVQADQAVHFVTESDGSNPQEIGRMPLRSVMDGVNDNRVRITDLHWTPSGKYLSFEYNGKLWQVPVP